VPVPANGRGHTAVHFAHVASCWILRRGSRKVLPGASRGVERWGVYNNAMQASRIQAGRVRMAVRAGAGHTLSTPDCWTVAAPDELNVRR